MPARGDRTSLGQGHAGDRSVFGQQQADVTRTGKLDHTVMRFDNNQSKLYLILDYCIRIQQNIEASLFFSLIIISIGLVTKYY